MTKVKKAGLLGLLASLVVAGVATFGSIKNNPFVNAKDDPYVIEFNSPLENVKPMDSAHPEKQEDYIKIGVGSLGVNGGGVAFQIRKGEAVENGVIKLNGKSRYNFGNQTPISGIYKIEGSVSAACELNYGFEEWSKSGRTEVNGDFSFTVPFSFQYFDFTLYDNDSEVTINNLKIYYSCIEEEAKTFLIKDFDAGDKSFNIDNKNYPIKANSTLIFDVLYKTDGNVKFMLGDGWSYYSGYHTLNKAKTGWFTDGIYAEGVQLSGWYRYIIKLGAAETNRIRDNRLDFNEKFTDIDLIYFNGNTASGSFCLRIDDDYSIETPMKTVSFNSSSTQTVCPTGIDINSKITVDLHIQSVTGSFAQLSMYGLKSNDDGTGLKDDWGGNIRIRFWKDGSISDQGGKDCSGVTKIKTYTDGDVEYNRYEIDLSVAPFADDYRPNCVKFIYVNDGSIIMKLVNVKAA